MKYILVYFVLTGILWTCDESEKILPPCDYSEEAVPVDCHLVDCTEIFVSRQVSVIDQNGNAFPADSTETYDECGNLIHTSRAADRSIYDNSFTLVNDGHMPQISYNGADFIMKVYMDGEEIGSGKYRVTKDCCHIISLYGPDEMVFDAEYGYSLNCGSPNGPECEDIFCIALWHSIDVSIKDAEGNPYPVEKVVTSFWGGTLFSETKFDFDGAWTVANDQHRACLSPEGSRLQFDIFAKGKLVATREFLAGGDCCKIIFLEGDRNIVIE